jgi:hypothetical protein
LTVLGGRTGGDRGIGLLVGEREHHPGERDAVGDAVVDAEEDRAPRPIPVDQVGLPERARAVDRPADQVAHELLQRGLVPGRRQSDPVQVLIDVEIGVILEAGRAAGRVAHPPPEAWELVDDAALQEVARAFPVDLLTEPDQRVHDHRVGWPIHVEPRRVGSGQGLAVHLAVGRAGSTIAPTLRRPRRRAIG